MSLMEKLIIIPDDELVSFSGEQKGEVLKALDETITHLEITLKALEGVKAKNLLEIERTRANIKECREFRDRLLALI